MNGRIERSFTMISDFAVLDDGRIVVRLGLTDAEGRRPWEIYSPDGELVEAWTVGSANMLQLRTTINPLDPREDLTWKIGTGVTKLVRFSPLP